MGNISVIYVTGFVVHCSVGNISVVYVPGFVVHCSVGNISVVYVPGFVVHCSVGNILVFYVTGFVVHCSVGNISVFYVPGFVVHCSVGNIFVFYVSLVFIKFVLYYSPDIVFHLDLCGSLESNINQKSMGRDVVCCCHLFTHWYLFLIFNDSIMIFIVILDNA